METKATVIGSSLAEPSILELANNQPLITVPPRYVHPEIDHPLIRNDDSSTQQLPVIDMHRLLSGDDSELEKLDHACKDWGFFQFIGGESESKIQDFFNLPIDEKKKFCENVSESGRNLYVYCISHGYSYIHLYPKIKDSYEISK
ncbi:hypothetical protein CICLE_v10003168mg [Citrus x clementina]|uniref:Non-haem dioxygenase N-terminal domain-containing protein n=1 Tax=Citrus clementina TaxID=85681 RepID=V4V2V0_CITCL|nr:hypothetical protein CICLE_v10003168mg [Citrus x clementina]